MILGGCKFSLMQEILANQFILINKADCDLQKIYRSIPSVNKFVTTATS